MSAKDRSCLYYLYYQKTERNVAIFIRVAYTYIALPDDLPQVSAGSQ